jgi:hypothetical protein
LRYIAEIKSVDNKNSRAIGDPALFLRFIEALPQLRSFFLRLGDLLRGHFGAQFLKILFVKLMRVAIHYL